MGAKSSKRKTKMQLEFSLPRDMLIHMIESVSDTFSFGGNSNYFQFIGINDFVKLRLLSKKWRDFVDEEERLWKSFYQQYFK